MERLTQRAIQPADVETVEATEGLRVAVYPTRGFTFYMTNLDPEKTEFFLEKPVRQALLYALDRESIVNDILLGYAEVAQGTQPVISYAYAPDRITTPYTYDPEKAKALLAEAGWTDTDGDGIVDKDGTAFAFELIYPSGIADARSNRGLHAGCLARRWRRHDAARSGISRRWWRRSRATTTSMSHCLVFNWDATFIQDCHVRLRPVRGRLQHGQVLQ